MEHWNNIAHVANLWSVGDAYHHRPLEFFPFLVPSGASLPEYGCGEGDLLAIPKPSRGLGVDFNPEMIKHIHF